jgi:hypothetical protein
MTWLNKEEWAEFERLFEKSQGTNYWDVREQALMLLSSKLGDKAREEKASLSDILSLVYMEDASKRKTNP